MSAGWVRGARCEARHLLIYNPGPIARLMGWSVAHQLKEPGHFDNALIDTEPNSHSNRVGEGAAVAHDPFFPIATRGAVELTQRILQSDACCLAAQSAA